MSNPEAIVQIVGRTGGEHPVAMVEVTRDAQGRVTTAGACHIPEKTSIDEIISLTAALANLQAQLLQRIGSALASEAPVATPQPGSPEVHDPGSTAGAEGRTFIPTKR